MMMAAASQFNHYCIVKQQRVIGSNGYINCCFFASSHIKKPCCHYSKASKSLIQQRKVLGRLSSKRNAASKPLKINFIMTQA